MCNAAYFSYGICSIIFIMPLNLTSINRATKLYIFASQYLKVVNEMNLFILSLGNGVILVFFCRKIQVFTLILI